ncbi:MAG: hypothetical protein JWN70_2904 [Planctomycetaceae bacterium]|nr:hypothetical protein [Planctomycetaceae bacterium]
MLEFKEAIAILKEFKQKLDKLDAENADLTVDDLSDARGAIEKLSGVKETITQLAETFAVIDFSAIEKLLDDPTVTELAEFERDAAYQEKIQEIDVGEDDKLAVQQAAAEEHALNVASTHFVNASDQITALTVQIDSVVESLDAYL